jgi:hypothetical protein
MQEMEIKFNFDTTRKILYKQYSGIVTFNDFEISWLNVIQNNVCPTETKGFLLDYRKAILEDSLNEAHKIADFFLSHLNIFGNKKIAFIASTPEQIVLPMLLSEYDMNYQSRPFSTIEAAESWIIE